MTWRDVTWREQVAKWTGRLLVFAAIVSFVSLILRRNGIVDVVADILGWLNIPAEPSVLMACFGLILAGGIRRRFRLAHTVLSVIMGLSILDTIGRLAYANHQPQLLNRLHRLHVRGVYTSWLEFQSARWVLILSLVVSVVSFIVFLMSRRAFRAKQAAGSWRAALAVLVVGWLIAFGITLTLAIVFARHLRGIGHKIGWSLRTSIGVDGTGVFVGEHGPHWIFLLGSTLSALALITAMLVLWRAGREAGHTSAAEELQLRRLIHEYGEDDSLGYFATRRDKSVIFSEDRHAAVTFRNEGSTSVASADPIGRPESWGSAIDAWLCHCGEHGLYPAVLSASADGARAFVKVGLKAWNLGDEAIINTEEFSLRGRSMRQVRQAVTRVERAGYTTQVRRHEELTQEELAELERLAAEWRGNATERGFSMALNRMADPADGRCVVITAHDSHGAIRGFLSFVPWGTRGLSLDLMRRDRAAENGINEFMVSHLAKAAPAMGIRRISLNFAVFRNVFADAEEVGAGPVTTITNKFLSFASRFWQLETLYRSNDKYAPTWVPRFLCYTPELTVPRAALAMGVAEGFLPVIGPRFLVGPRPDEHQPPRREPDFLPKLREIEDEVFTPRVPQPRFSEQQRVRRTKLTQMADAGVESYPVAVERSTTVSAVVARHEGLAADSNTGEIVSVTGRIRALRDFGGVTFGVLEEDGARVQVMVTREDTEAIARDRWRSWVDLGDIVAVTGEVVASRLGELSIRVSRWEMAAKCLSPVPPLGAKFLDPEARMRNRSLDLIVNPDSLDILQRRSRGVRAFREALSELGYLEVETPMLQAVHGGAAARPFKTHINAYDMPLFLRIAPELYLKRLAVGGMGKVFELNRNFRNEGVDATHNPEFTSLEAYDAYGDYNTMRVLTREMLLKVAEAVNGDQVVLRRQAGGTVETMDISGQWPVVPVHEAVSKASGVTLTSASTREEVAAVCAKFDIEAPREMSAGELIVELYDELVEGQTTFPTFYTDFPVETSPLTRQHRSDPKLSERWDLVAFGAEIGTAYSELVDPVEQRKRLTQQSLKAAAGDVEAMSLDESFLGALEYAMPPTGGLGIGVDRSIMMMLGVPIRPTLAFPFVKPQG